MKTSPGCAHPGGAQKCLDAQMGSRGQWPSGSCVLGGLAAFRKLTYIDLPPLGSFGTVS